MKFQLELLRWKDGYDPGKEADPRDWPSSAEPAEHPDEATLISSRIAGQATDAHVIAVDIDLPCHLIETSPGKHHLIIEKALTWPQYETLLCALANCGVVEPGFVAASLERKSTELRIHPTTPLEVDL